MTWFCESEVMWPGQKFCLEQSEVLFQGRSKLQDILVFQSKSYGKVLVLDGVIQVTERDEFSYQEMITHTALFSHPNPQRVCVIGGGDGGVVRELCKHESVKEIVMCEIDAMVCDTSKKYFRETLAVSFEDPRLTLLHEDGAKYLEETKDKFDVIIVDSSDPVGPAETLFEESFFKKAQGALDPKNGILCTQGECIWLHLNLIKDVMTRCGHLFPTVNYSFTTIPTYPSGQIGFVLSCNNPHAILSQPLRLPSPSIQDKLRYYNAHIHQASFVLPGFAEKVICQARKEGLTAVARWRKAQHLIASNVSIIAFTAGVGAVLGAFLARR